MCGTESVIDKHIGQGSQLFGEGLAVLCLFDAIASVLQQDHLAVFHSFYSCLRVRADNVVVRGEFHFLTQQFGQAHGHRCQRKFRLRLALRLAQMGAEDDFSAVRDQFFDGRKRSNQTILVCDFSFFQRHVEVAADQNALTLYLNIIYRFFI